MKKNIQPCESRKLLIVNNQMGGSGTGLEKAKMKKKSSSILTTDLIWQPDPGGRFLAKENGSVVGISNYS